MPQSISAPDPPPTVTLRVSAPNPSAEIFVIDHRLQLVDRGAGELETRQPPGVYKIKVQSGRDAQEKTVLLVKDESIVWEPQPIDSAAPLPNSAASDANHMAGASVRSRNIDVTRGTGGRLFIMVRRSSTDARSRGISRSEHPAAGLRVADWNGAWTEDLGQLPVEDAEREAWCACNISLDPGTYLLQWARTSGTVLEQAVTVSPGWQTQVFLLERAVPERSPVATERPARNVSEMLNATILMSADGFDPHDVQFQLTETARLALADDRPVLNQQLADMLRGKFDNPMLGIMGAHLLLLGLEEQRGREAEQVRRQRLPSSRTALQRRHHPWDQSLFDTIVSNLQRLVGGDHPDVQALSLRASRDSMRATRVTAPPMLRRSWSLLVAASNEQPELVPIDLWHRTAMRTAAAPFMCWIAPSGDPTIREAFVADLRAHIGVPLRQLATRRTRLRGAARRIIREVMSRDPVHVSLDLDIPRAAVEWLVKRP